MFKTSQARLLLVDSIVPGTGEINGRPYDVVQSIFVPADSLGDEL
mgnify:CR=1 FL=1